MILAKVFVPEVQTLRLCIIFKVFTENPLRREKKIDKKGRNPDKSDGKRFIIKTSQVKLL